MSRTVRLRAGLAVVTMSHDGVGEFAVTLLDTSGQTLGALVAAQGPWFGSRGVTIAADGEFAVEVTADSRWRVEIMNPDTATSIVSDAPFEQTGTGSQAVYFVKVQPGEHTIVARSDADAPFALALERSDGSPRDEIFAADTVFEGSNVFTVEGSDPVYLLIDIISSGNWLVRVE